jgi:hypothetical protein
MKKIEILFFVLLYANIFSQNLRIISPGVDKEYFLGDRIPVSWKDISGEPLDRVNISFSFNNEEWQTITSNYEPGMITGLFSWQTKPDMKSGKYKIKIGTLYGNGKEFIIDGKFFLVKKEAKDEEENEICYPVLLSQGFTERLSLCLYYFSFTFEPAYYFFDNNFGIGLNIGAAFVNSNRSLQTGPYLNFRLTRDILKFENMILGRFYFTASFLFQNNNRKIFESGFLMEAGLSISLKFGREFWKNEWYLTSGVGINLGLLF